MERVLTMTDTKRKVLLLTFIFAVMLVCIMNTRSAQAASKTSLKTRAEKTEQTVKIRQPRIASRSGVASIGSADDSSVISYAKNYLGSEYKYGAAGPSAFDCSGFTMFIMQKLAYPCRIQQAGSMKLE
jgi:cell wall-associated NlpC family hydrolase